MYNKLLPSGKLETNFEQRVSKTEVSLLESNLGNDDISSLLPYSISYKRIAVSSLHSKGKDYTGHEYKEAGSLGAILKSDYQSLPSGPH